MFKSWQIKHSPEPATPDNIKKYRIKSLDELKAKLAETKSKLDLEYKKPKFATYWSNFDPFKYERTTVATIGNTANVSNAWLKCVEIIQYYQLAEPIKSNGVFLHFDNAAFPGSFIIATHHLINTLYDKYSGKYVWRASSLLNANEQNTEPLEDKYGLYENYRSHWLMHEKNNGDVLIEENQKDFHRQLGGKVDLYTSDLGFDVSSDYNNQESIQMPANMGQILTGLLTLKPGGSFITKQYTNFEPSTIAVMYAASFFFEEFYLCKPFTSRAANSETYLVGKGFKGGACFDHPYIVAMLDRIAGRTAVEIPMFDARAYPKEYLLTIIKASRDLNESQIEKLEADIERVNSSISSRYNGPPKEERTVREFHDTMDKEIYEWFKTFPILPIAESKKINMRDGLNQIS